jgi:hypothetical protein
MLRSQYGVAAFSSVTPTALHAEDVQPNEVIYKRRYGRPPQIGPYKRRHGRPLQIGPIIPAETSTVKKEPCTPPPAPSRMERTLITSSCKFYPIPEFCKKTFPGFKENRNAFFREKMQELTRLGLTKVKSFFRYVLPTSARCTYHKVWLSIRDDGLAIEWYAISLYFAAYLIYFPTGRVKSLYGLIPYFRNFQTLHQPLNVHIR